MSLWRRKKAPKNRCNNKIKALKRGIIKFFATKEEKVFEPDVGAPLPLVQSQTFPATTRVSHFKLHSINKTVVLETKSCITLTEDNREFSTRSLPTNESQSDLKTPSKFKSSASLSKISKGSTEEMSVGMMKSIPVFEEIQAFEPDLNAKPKKPVLKGALLHKIQRRDTIAKRTDLPKPVDDIPNQTPDDRKRIMHRVSLKLERKLSERPTEIELKQRNILKPEEAETISKQSLEETRKMLLRKLSFRPTIQELKEKQIIKFNDYVEVTEAEIYDRKGEKPWTRLTPSEKALIRKELNDFKATEMLVHEESKIFTRFHRP